MTTAIVGRMRRMPALPLPPTDVAAVVGSRGGLAVVMDVVVVVVAIEEADDDHAAGSVMAVRRPRGTDPPSDRPQAEAAVAETAE
jgi:hypothetical protein